MQQPTSDPTADLALGGGDSADEQALIHEHLYLVQHIVNQVAHRYPLHVDRSDLWSAGACGLVEAAKRYDVDSGVPFARYASIRIRGAIIDSARARDWATRRVRREARGVEEAAQQVQAESGRAADVHDIADKLGVDVAEVRARQDAVTTATVLRLDMPVPGSEGERTFGEQLAEGDQEVLPGEHLEHQELLGTLRTAVRHLDPVQREVVERYFFDDELLRDIAEDLGCTEARVSQIRTEALNAIRAYLSTGYDGVPEVPANAPGVRRRATFVATVAAASTWRVRLEAGAGAGVAPSVYAAGA